MLKPGIGETATPRFRHPWACPKDLTTSRKPTRVVKILVGGDFIITNDLSDGRIVGCGHDPVIAQTSCKQMFSVLTMLLGMIE